MVPLNFPRPDATLPVSFGSRPGASWRGVRPLEAPDFSRERCHCLHSAQHVDLGLVYPLHDPRLWWDDGFWRGYRRHESAAALARLGNPHLQRGGTGHLTITRDALPIM